ncbi:hypothetical protein DAETH_46050 (plasmid) [Deinococcus aetherius]|uniref:DUF3105 domain-containing protein n=1 Tax=Deinococcus aetherius TaxID=200252 RepID=A0ABN6RRU6_9DEIO|nr:DUF3105 domain-containing protein [Deinococcus aetherius]BDP44636.1 hypothetical protein DAETH_46050 [Deinococcus aetherius]
MTPPLPSARSRPFWGLWLAVPAVLAACSARPLAGVQTFTFRAGDHREGRLVYEQTPPAGGPHNPSWQNCGVYASALYNEYVVHSLEHGAVWITYRPTLSPEGVRTLASLAQGRTHVLVSPNGGQTAPVVLTAWGAQLPVTEVGDSRIKAFLKRYEQGPTTPERGAACTGGYSGTL